MGQPVQWQYELVVTLMGDTTHVEVFRRQRGTDTRFRWLETQGPALAESPGLDELLQYLYAVVLDLMTLEV